MPTTCLNCQGPMPYDVPNVQKTCSHSCANLYNGKLRKERNDQLRAEGKPVVKAQVLRNPTSGVPQIFNAEFGLCKEVNRAVTQTLKRWEESGRIPKQILNKY